MTTKSKLFIVCHNNSAHAPRLKKESKGFRDKQQARAYAAILQQEKNDTGWIVVELETVLD